MHLMLLQASQTDPCLWSLMAHVAAAVVHGGLLLGDLTSATLLLAPPWPVTPDLHIPQAQQPTKITTTLYKHTAAFGHPSTWAPTTVGSMFGGSGRCSMPCQGQEAQARGSMACTWPPWQSRGPIWRQEF